MTTMSRTELTKRSFFSIRERRIVETLRSLDPKSFYCTLDGEIVDNFLERIEDLPADGFFQLHFRILGGKGGFGSLLRSFRVNKSTNQLMCRDLNGRRLASIDEEQRLKRWIERTAEREREKIAKKKAKYEKLKSGPPKHMFHDPEYMRQKETIIEKTEEAFEAGFMEALKAEREKKEKPVESSSDSDFDIDDLPGSLTAKRKRKAGATSTAIEQKKKKMEEDEDDDSSSDSEENDVDPELLREIQDYFAAQKGESTSSNRNDEPTTSKVENSSISSKGEGKTEENHTNAEGSGEDSVVKEKSTELTEFFEVDLSLYDSPVQLEELGLAHLKHALTARGMKCGGTLRERAERLFSAKKNDKDKA